MPFNHHGLSSTDYHAKVHMQENKENAFSECADTYVNPLSILLDTVCDKYVVPRTA